MKRTSESGVTLIEILIAVSLLSLLSVGMLVAMRLGFTTMDKTDSRLVRNRRVSNTSKIVENEIDGFIAATAAYHPQPGNTYLIPFLQTEAQTMRFVTSYSLDQAWRGGPRIAVMQVIPGENNRGVRLIVNEAPYTGPEGTGQQILGIEQDPASGAQIVRFVPVAPGPDSFVLADKLAYCRFSYLQPLPEPPFEMWRPDWVIPQQLPLGIRIEMAPLDAENSSELRIGTVTVPLNVNRTPGTNYADFVAANPQ
jgi:general secretion pathway protein J